MKKLSWIFIALLALGLVACGDDSSSTDDDDNDDTGADAEVNKWRSA